MNVIKKSVFVLVLLLVVVIVWVASSIYFERSEVNINPNASSYTDQLEKNFNIEELEKIIEKTEESLPISPQDFFNLVEDN
jgi:hypothetical protein